MARTIIFLNGFLVPKILAKTHLCWDDPFWEGYNRIYYSSKTPISDYMVEKELDNLCKLTHQYPDAIIAGQSLGAWWAANLACHPESKIKKLVFWTPVGDINELLIFNVTKRHHPIYKQVNDNNYGPHRACLFYAKNDLVVPPEQHAVVLKKIFNPTIYCLDGGHLLQNDHKAGLSLMKEWIELD